MEARVLSRKIVKPAVPTPDHLRTCKLSVFDQLAPPDHVPIIFLYGKSSLGHDTLREQLVKSLSQTLTRFYPLAGRFVQDGFFVDCNDKGVEYIEAAVDIELSGFLKVAPKNMHLTNNLVPNRESFGKTHLVTTPILVLQVNFFKCGGLAIGMYLSHIVADGFTAAAFVKDWANTASALINDEMVSCSPSEFGVIASVFPARDLPVAVKPPPISSPKKNESKIVTRRFVFDENALSTLKAKVSKTANINRPTRVEVVMSTIWKAFISIGGSQSKSKNSTLFIHLNLRGRTGIVVTPRDNRSFICGNFYMQVPTKFKENDEKPEEVELHQLVNLLRSSLHNTLANCAKISSPDGLFLEVAKNVKEIQEDRGNEEVDVHLLSTMCRLPLYEIDFGWGKPEWVTMPLMPLEVVFLLDTKCGTGIEALVNLNEIDMIQFEKHEDMVAYIS